MIKSSLLVAIVVGGAAVAHAGGQPGSIGVGAEYELVGLGGPSIDYDAGQFHVGGFLALSNPGAGRSLFEMGARFYYHVHKTAMADFGLGGGFGLASVPPAMGTNNRTTAVFLEPSFQIRLFLASNVALSFTGGLVIGVVDASGFAITAQGISSTQFATVGLGGGAGIYYYFF